jgi:hypothetical protein
MALINQQQKDKRFFFFFFWLDFCRERWKKLSAPWVIGHHTLWAMARGAIFILLAPPTTTTTTTFLKRNKLGCYTPADRQRERENSKELIDFYKYPPPPAINWNENENPPDILFRFCELDERVPKNVGQKERGGGGEDRSYSSPSPFFPTTPGVRMLFG